jgi:hypothetical protein
VVRASGTAFAFPDAPERYTTLEVRDTQREAVEHAVRRRGDGVAVVVSEHLGPALADRPTLSDQQVVLVTRLVTSGAGVDVDVHTDGEAATYALAAATAAWREQGVAMVDLAYHEATVRELRQRGLDADLLGNFSTGTLRPDHYEHGRLRPHTVAVVHEAETSGTFPLDDALRQAARHDAKVVVLGDPRARPPGDDSGGGGLFRELAAELGHFHLARDLMGRVPLSDQARATSLAPDVARTLRPLDTDASWLSRRIGEDDARLARLRKALRETPPWRLTQRRDLPDRIRIAERSVAAARKRLQEIGERKAEVLTCVKTRGESQHRRHLTVARNVARDTSRRTNQPHDRVVGEPVTGARLLATRRGAGSRARRRATRPGRTRRAARTTQRAARARRRPGAVPLVRPPLRGPVPPHRRPRPGHGDPATDRRRTGRAGGLRSRDDRSTARRQQAPGPAPPEAPYPPEPITLPAGPAGPVVVLDHDGITLRWAVAEFDGANISVGQPSRAAGIWAKACETTRHELIDVEAQDATRRLVARAHPALSTLALARPEFRPGASESVLLPLPEVVVLAPAAVAARVVAYAAPTPVLSIAADALPAEPTPATTVT